MEASVALDVSQCSLTIALARLGKIASVRLGLLQTPLLKNDVMFINVSVVDVAHFFLLDVFLAD